MKKALPAVTFLNPPLPRRWFLGRITALLAIGPGAALFSGTAVAATSPEGASAFMATLADRALTVMRSPEASLAQRESEFRKILARGFDLALIGRFVLGHHWRRLPSAKKTEYQRLFGIYILNSYTSRFGGYSGEKFTIMSARAAGKKDAVVRSRIDRPSGAPVTADWRIRAQGNEYRIIDVTVEGISMAITQRSEFAAMIKSTGVDGLIAALRARADKIPVVASK